MADDMVTIEKPGVAVSQETNGTLVGIGVGLVLLALVLVGVNWAVGSETKTTKPPTVGSAAAAKTTTTKTQAGPSESLLTAVLGAGAALIVVGFLYGRISSIKLPGGAEIGLTPDEKQRMLEKAVAANPEEPAKVAMVAKEAEDRLLAKKIAAPVELPNATIDDVVSDIVENVA